MPLPVPQASSPVVDGVGDDTVTVAESEALPPEPLQVRVYVVLTLGETDVMP